MALSVSEDPRDPRPRFEDPRDPRPVLKIRVIRVPFEDLRDPRPV